MNAFNLLLRGSIVRNTDWVIGLAVYMGKDTKLLCSTAAESRIQKVTGLQRYAHVTEMCLFSFLFLLCVALAAAEQAWLAANGGAFYLGQLEGAWAAELLKHIGIV